MKAERICIIGGGRLWTIQFLKDLAYNRDTHGTVVLYDRTGGGAQQCGRWLGASWPSMWAVGRFTVTSEEELGKALDGCTLIIISIEPGSTELRRGDLLLSEEYGILQSVGDTTGPGGIMRARRAIPLFVEFAAAIARHCPEAWVINYTNPMTLCTAALHAGFPAVKALGCCHEVFHTQDFLAERVSAWFSVPRPDRRQITVDLTGINHFTFVTSATWEGHDLMARLREDLQDPHLFDDRTAVAKKRLAGEQWFDCDQLIALSFLRDFGALGAVGTATSPSSCRGTSKATRSCTAMGSFTLLATARHHGAPGRRKAGQRCFTDSELRRMKSDEEGGHHVRVGRGALLRTISNRPNEGQVSTCPREDRRVQRCDHEGIRSGRSWPAIRRFAIKTWCAMPAMSSR